MRDGRPRPPLWWLFGDLFRCEPLHLASPLSLNDARRVLEVLGLNVVPGGGDGTRVRGRIVGGRVVATTRTMQNSVDNPYAFGRIVPSTNGTELRGEIRTTRFAQVVVPAVALVCAVACVSVAAQGRFTSASVLSVAVFCSFSAIIGHLASWVARPGWSRLREGLREALRATDLSEVTGDPPV